MSAQQGELELIQPSTSATSVNLKRKAILDSGIESLRSTGGALLGPSVSNVAFCPAIDGLHTTVASGYLKPGRNMVICV